MRYASNIRKFNIKKGGISNHAGLVIDHKNCHLAILRTATPCGSGRQSFAPGPQNLPQEDFRV